MGNSKKMTGVYIDTMFARVLHGAILLMSIVLSAHAQQAPAAHLRGHITISELPQGVELRPPTGISRADLTAQLERQPAVILDGAVLEITAPAAGSSRSLMMKRLELLNNSRIVTNGTNLEIYAGTTVSQGGGILAFESATKGAAVAGQNGETGLDAGTVVIDTQLAQNNVLYVNLSGQSGEDGGPGVAGPPGAQGPRGENGADHIFDCAHGAGNGGAGSQGGAGGAGGNGGAGGAGGQLILRGQVAAQRSQVEFSAPGGNGGRGGPGGAGGVGGPGGPGGNKTTYCRSGNNGITGPKGNNGADGSPGVRGKDGRILAD